MNVKKWITATIVAGIVVNVYDTVFHGWLLRGTYEGLPELFRADSPIGWLVIGEFLAAAVLVWFYDRVYDAFGGGIANGAKFGFYAGVLLGFPAQLFANMMFVGFPYGLAWIWVVLVIGWGVLAGAIAGAIYGTGAKAIV